MKPEFLIGIILTAIAIMTALRLPSILKRRKKRNTRTAAELIDLQKIRSQLAAEIKAIDVPASSVEDEFSVICRGLSSRPGRFLNLVHGIPKAGNSTLLNSLWASQKIVNGAFSSHFLSNEAAEFDKQQLANKLKNQPHHECERRLITREILGQLGYLNDWNNACKTTHKMLPLKVICPFRDPVASALSLRFYLNSLDDSEKVTCNVQPLINEAAEDPSSFVKWMTRWAEIELKGIHGLDLFEAGFDSERGYSIYKLPDRHVLVITLEAFAKLPQAIGELYNTDSSLWVNKTTNSAETRQDAAAYQNAREAFRLSSDEADLIYDAPISRLLYTKDQLAAFKAKWTRQ